MKDSVTDEELRKLILKEIELLLERERESIVKKAQQKLREMRRSDDGEEKLS